MTGYQMCEDRMVELTNQKQTSEGPVIQEPMIDMSVSAE